MGGEGAGRNSGGLGRGVGTQSGLCGCESSSLGGFGRGRSKLRGSLGGSGRVDVFARLVAGGSGRGVGTWTGLCGRDSSSLGGFGRGSSRSKGGLDGSRRVNPLARLAARRLDWTLVFKGCKAFLFFDRSRQVIQVEKTLEPTSAEAFFRK
jgi:hypothetical protein